MKWQRVSITWDITIFMDRRRKYNRPDISVVHKDTQEWTLTDTAVPGDQNILVNEQRVERYQDLALEIKRIHRVTKETE